MSEQKVWVEKLPESCSKCLFCYDNRPYWKSTDCIINHKELDEDEIETSRDKDCPLIDIKTHDRELVKEVCEKIRKTIASTVDLAESNQQIKDQFNIILDLIQKEYEK